MQARYDEIADFYAGIVDDRMGDPPGVALLELVGDVRGRRVLDVACGQGRTARALARRGATVVGIDLSTAMLDRAAAAEGADPLGIAYLEADVGSPETLAGEEFDAVVCS